jgi:hypothetical protein
MLLTLYVITYTADTTVFYVTVTTRSVLNILSRATPHEFTLARGSDHRPTPVNV